MKKNYNQLAGVVNVMKIIMRSAVNAVNNMME